MIKFKCKDFLLKECEFEAKAPIQVDEMMKLVEVKAGDEHRTLRLSAETIEKIRTYAPLETCLLHLYPRHVPDPLGATIFWVRRLMNKATDLTTRIAPAIAAPMA